ncbi:MAG: UDP-N-acetylmuramate--L-alanine ligase [Minisyncoccales bacterium]
MRIHFIGIGGIGVSALAQHYLNQGHQVSGSDLVISEITELLKKKGAKILIGRHKKSNLNKNLDLVVYSPAVQANNPELQAAQKLNLKILSYPQALGELTQDYLTIAVCGTHGKSTVTAMIGLLLTKAKLDPTVIVGTKLKEFGNSNYRAGKSQFLVIEADEHFASFLNYSPDIIVLTSLDPDHLDYYKNFKNYFNAFKQFISRLSFSGILVANKDDQDIVQLQKQIVQLPIKIKNYSLSQPESKKLRKILKIPGEHNVANSLAVLTIARLLKIPNKITFYTLSQYRGAWRRFEELELKIKNLKLKIINDYGHHPAEIKATLEAARQKYFDKKIWCVFQPHQYQRTYYLFNDFVKVFQHCPIDQVIITDIYSVAGRENPQIKAKVNAQKLVKKIARENVIYLKKNKILSYLQKNFSHFNILIIMGAGDIYSLSKHF